MTKRTKLTVATPPGSVPVENHGRFRGRDGTVWTALLFPVDEGNNDVVFVGDRRDSNRRPRRFIAEVRRVSCPSETRPDFTSLVENAGERYFVSRDELEAHRANARECFDGMRAYHLSEISHTGYGLDLLKAILGSTVAGYGAMIGVAASGERGTILTLLAFLFWLGLVRVLWVVTRRTKDKVDSDHVRYEEFRSELIKERALLGLHAAWHLRHQRPGSGYNYTKTILNTAAVAIAGLGFMGFILVFALAD